jgi:hypothetical protein
VVVCSRDGNTENVLVNHYYKQKNDSELKRLPIRNDGLKSRFGLYDAGIIFCNFSRALLSEESFVNSLNTGHYIYVGRGSPGNNFSFD